MVLALSEEITGLNGNRYDNFEFKGHSPSYGRICPKIETL